LRNAYKITLILVLSSLTLVYQNCSQNFSANGTAQFSSLCKAQPTKLSPFYLNKNQIQNIESSSLQKASPMISKISIVVNPSCLVGSEYKFTLWDQDYIIDKEFQNLKKWALDIEIQPNLNQASIEEVLNKNSCIIGLAQNLEMNKSQTTPALTINDPQASQQKHLEFLGLTKSLKIQSLITQPVVVAVIDTGVDYNHLDLKNRMWSDANGNHGYNFVSNNTEVRDDDGHGTHLAGIIAAEQNNNFGVAGLTGDFIKIMAIKSLDSGGTGSTQSVYNGIQYAIANKADIINLSLSALGKNPLLEDALIDAVEAGIVITVAAGNQSDEIRDNNLYAPAYIGSSLDGVIAVASVDTQTTDLSYFSNYSNIYAEIAGPGAESSNTTSGGILSTAPNDRWMRISGTSQAAPMVASAAAILIGYLKTNNIRYTANAIELFLKTDGSAINPNLINKVNDGHIINLSFLATNLEYYSKTGIDQLDFTGKGSGHTCVLKSY
jgi:hypothetical protein